MESAITSKAKVMSVFCEIGWKGHACDQCHPYCDCPNQKPNACNIPNECHCDPNTFDPKGLCCHKDLDKSNTTSLCSRKLRKFINEFNCSSFLTCLKK